MEKEIETNDEIDKTTIQNENTQVKWFLGIIGLCFILFFVSYYYVQSQQAFEHNGVTYQIEKQPDVTFYHTQFGKYYNAQYFGEHNTYLRNDPRKNDITIDDGPTYLQQTVIITQTPQVLQCNRQILVTDGLFQITQSLPFIKERVIAITNQTVAEQYDRPYATCNNKPENTTVIQVQLADNSHIYKDEKNDCYTIQIDSCTNNLKAAERFIIDIIEQING